ncbi:MAG: hypothetical protein ABR920_07445 [Terriglobales bacterium]
MKTRFTAICLFLVALFIPALAQTGAGNGNAIALAQKSPAVQTAYNYLIGQAHLLQDTNLRAQTLDAITNPNTCVMHRANVSPAMQQTIVNQLLAAGLVDPNLNATFPGGIIAGVFPAIVNDGTACPQLPQRFFSAPGSTSGTGHHSYPGGLMIHEANNETSHNYLANQYRAMYGQAAGGFVSLDPKVLDKKPAEKSDVFIDQDIIVGAPIWHDWGKSIVFQWNADGSEFPELNFGGNGVTDAWGAAGNSETGGHHMISIAESMARGFSPAFVIAQASAHSNPTSGNEYKVVNWVHAAAIMAQIDPVAAGYLIVDQSGNLRLPPLRQLGGIDFADQGQPNVLAEYTLHNLSDADFTYSGPAIIEVNIILQTLASRYGYNPSNTSVYNNGYRNPVLSFSTAEHLLMLYSGQGLAGVQAELDKLKKDHII